MVDKTIRDVIREMIVEHVIKDDDRVLEPSVAEHDTPKPFVVVREGTSTEAVAHDKGNVTFEVWPNVERTSLTDLDVLIKEIEQAINHTILVADGIPYYIQYNGLGTEDIIVEDWDAYTKSMNFEVIPLDWRNHSNVEPDPIECMVRWTNEHTDYQTNPKEWHPSDDVPAVYWRQEQVLRVDQRHWGSFVYARLRGHVISPSLEVRRAGTERLLRQAILTGHLHMSDRSVMTLLDVSSNDGYNPFTDGQIMLDVRCGVLKEYEGTALKHIYTADNKIKGEMHDDE